MAVTQPRPEPPRRPARRPHLFWSRLHFLIRFAGLTGFLAGCIGLVLAGLGGRLPSAQAVFDDCWAALQGDRSVLPALGQLQAVFDDCWAALRGQPAVLSTWLFLVGTLSVLLAVLVEALVIVQRTAARRSAFGFNALAQVGLAAALLVAVNVFSAANFHFPLFGRDFSWRAHYLRLDWTRSGQFTLPAGIRAQLEQLDPRSQTTVVVYQRHKKDSDAEPDDPDYDEAAEAKVAEKVKDLAAQFREVGPQLRVEVLARKKGYRAKLADLTRGAPELRRAIESAPESSIFIDSGGRVQQLSFNEFYRLDKVASGQANGGRGNLVLLAQGSSGRGVEPFADKILNLEERRPRVGVLVVHELLTTEGSEDAFALKGLRKMLKAHGFEVRDVVLKKGWDTGPPQPAVDTFEESKLERLDSEIEDLEADVKTLEEDVKNTTQLVEEWSLKPGEDEGKKLDQLSRKYARQLGGRRVSSAGRRLQLEVWKAALAQSQDYLAETKRERDRVKGERAGLDVDRATESRRMTDLKAKLARVLADCDLLLVPRLTRRSNGGFIPTPKRIHGLDESQVAGIKEFLKAGKPVLACFGPLNEPAELGFGPDLAGPDNLESLLGELGIHFGKQTVLFNADSKAFADRRANPLRSAGTVEVPPLDFDSPTEALGGWLRQGGTKPLPPNPVREGLRVTAHSIGKGFDLSVRFPRPIYYEPATEARPAAAAAALGTLGGPGQGSFLAAASLLAGRRPRAGSAPFDPTFLLTAPGAWNDDQPFPTRSRRPRYEPPKPDDPDNGTRDARRRGAFPIGVAVETALPPSWTDGSTKDVRLAVIGQGELFVGNELSPARERLFLQTANWLLGRDDYLPRADHPWSYPRIDLQPGSEGEQLWLWGARLGLPALCAYLGLVVLLVRRLR
jgi:hypothetical protein